MDIQQRLQQQKERIKEAALACGRDPGGIVLIAASKHQDTTAIRRAYAAGQRDFGENYVQELVAKADELKDLVEIRWHMIGHLQSNKCKSVVGVVELVHTVSSVKLAHEIAKRALSLRIDAGRTLPLEVLVEVNVSGEAAKSGCRPEDLGEILRAIDSHNSLRASGLMTMPQATENPEGAFPQFQRLTQLRGEHGGVARLPELSMGMSQDVEMAIAAGATLVRIGTAIFGARP